MNKFKKILILTSFVNERRLRLKNSHMPHNYVESYNACIRKETKKDFEGFERFWDQGFSKTHKEMLDKSEKSNVKADKK